MSLVVDEALAWALRSLQEATGDADGADFVEALARGVARAFAADFTLVGEVDPAEPSLVRPLAGWADGAPVGFAPYRLAGTPCAEVVEGCEVCVFTSGVRDHFPQDRVFGELKIESYAGVAVRGRDGQVVGLVAAFDRAARPEFAVLAPALAAFTAQTRWSIERGRLELHLRRSLARSRALTRIATDLHAAHVQPDEAFRRMCAEVRAVLEVSAVAVTMVDPSGRLDRRAHVGLPEAWLAAPPAVPEAWLDANLPPGEVLVLGREQMGVHPPGSLFERIGLSWSAVTAMRHEGELVGFITALQFGGERALTAEDRAWIDAVAGLLAQVVGAGRLLEALRRSEQSYRRIVTTTHEGVWTVDAQQRTSFVNQRMADLVGYTVEEMLGRRLHDFVAPEDHALITAKFAERRAGVREQYEHRYLRKDGTRVMVQASVSPLLDDAGVFVGALAMVRDVTELRRLESRMLHSQKLESLGVLAGGIAHDFNNLLVGILGNVGLARSELPEGAPAQSYLKDAQVAATRAADLTAQMLAYAGKGRFVIQPLDLNQLIAEIAHLLTAVISKKARLHTEFAADLPATPADATQIRQVVMNLITNASDALGEQPGTISVRTGVVEADAAMLAGMYGDERLAPGRYVLLSVSDTGCGFDAATQARLFDPFFTTKFTGRGLGLAAVLGILRGHGGAIAVEGAPQQGARFTVLLPAAASPVVLPPRSNEASVGRGAGLVLVADDEPGVRTVARRVLERAGYTVCVAGDGREAVAVFTARADEIVAVLLDMTMPLLRGDEVYRELRKVRADVPVVLTSGYSDPEQAASLAGTVGFLAKPWTPQELLATLREVLKPG
ncbi:MAG: PAS domain S-box protein [Myxococcales bacterium]|nr:PAS domain S-box protein [Myxococcales bacterium]